MTYDASDIPTTLVIFGFEVEVRDLDTLLGRKHGGLDFVCFLNPSQLDQSLRLRHRF